MASNTGECKKTLPPQVLDQEYTGSGTTADPFLVKWLHEDAENPLNFGETKKWFLNFLAALSAFTVALASSAYSGGLVEIVEAFGTSQEITLLGTSLFVIGFSVGPLLWAPLSEAYGRRNIFIASGAALTATLAGTAGAHNIETLLVLRFLASWSVSCFLYPTCISAMPNTGRRHYQ